MRVAIVTVSTGVALFFMASLGLTFFAKEYITGLAQEFVAIRTQRFAEPTVAIAEQALQTPGIHKVLDDKAIQTAKQEIADYRSDPCGYIGKLVGGKRWLAPAIPGREALLEERALRWKDRVREHFDRTLDRLVRDLRIYSGSNLAAAILAGWCALRAKGSQVNWLLGVAGLLLASVVYGAFMYVDGLSYFRILLGTYLGWWYPVLLAMTFLGLYLEYGPPRSSPPNRALRPTGAIGSVCDGLTTQQESGGKKASGGADDGERPSGEGPVLSRMLGKPDQ